MTTLHFKTSVPFIQTFAKNRPKFRKNRLPSLLLGVSEQNFSRYWGRVYSPGWRMFTYTLPNLIYRKQRIRRKTPQRPLRNRFHSILFRKKRRFLLRNNYTIKRRYYRAKPGWKYPRRAILLRLPYSFKRSKSRYTSHRYWITSRTIKQTASFFRPSIQFKFLFLLNQKVLLNRERKLRELDLTLIQRSNKILKTLINRNYQNQKTYLAQKATASLPKVGAKSLAPEKAEGKRISKRFELLTSPLKKGTRGFSTLSRLIPKKIRRVSRRVLRAHRTLPSFTDSRRRTKPRPWVVKKSKRNPLLHVKRKSKWKDKKWASKTGTKHRNVKKFQRGFKRWKWRFPRWKRYPRLRGDWQPTRWQAMDLFPYRLYRRPHQPYRRRKPWQQKKHKRLRLLRQKTQRGRLLRRSEFLTLQKRYFQVYSNFYGHLTLRQLRKHALHFRNSSVSRTSRLSQALTWFDNRLDVTLCRLRLAPTLQIARLLVLQGYARINGDQVRIPEKRVSVWDLVQITLESEYFFGKYWYSRNRYQRHLYRQPRNRFKHVHPQKLVLPFGFLTRSPRLTDLPRYNRLSWQEFGRLLLI